MIKRLGKAVLIRLLGAVLCLVLGVACAIAFLIKPEWVNVEEWWVHRNV
jgi:hypothetical protein